MTKIAIVGFTGSRDQAPFEDGSFDIWGMNNLHVLPGMKGRRFTAWFETHKRELLEHKDNFGEHLRFLSNLSIPLIAMDASEWPEVPNVIQLPIDEIEKLGRFGSYQTSSPSWMVATAILAQPEEIHVYGIDFSSKNEYDEQRPALEAWLGFAQGLGIEVYVPPVCDLFKTVAQYGRGEMSAFRQDVKDEIKVQMSSRESTQNELANLRRDYKQKRDILDEDFDTKEKQLLKKLHQIEGRVLQCEHMLQNWTTREGEGGRESVEDLAETDGKPNRLVAVDA